MKDAVVRRMRNPSAAESEGALARLGRLARERIDGEVDAEHEIAQRARLLAALYPVSESSASIVEEASAPDDTNDRAAAVRPIVRRKSLR
jgi:hypothetical protein